MAARYFSQFGQKKVRASKGPPPGKDGTAGSGPALKEKTAAWPEAGPAGSSPFNKKLKWNVVKTAAKKAGVS